MASLENNASRAAKVPSAKSEKRNRLIIWILAFFTLMLAAGLMVNYVFLTDKNEKLISDNEKLQTEIVTLEKDIENMEAELKTATVDKEALQSKLKNLQDNIAYQKIQVTKAITAGKLSNDEMEKFKGMTDQLEFYKERYRNKVAELQREIDELKEVVESRDMTIKEQSEVIDNQKSTINMTRQTLETGAQLIASDFEYIGINGRGKEFKGPEIKARNLRELRICFNVNKNQIADGGNKDLFVVIKSESGKVYRSRGTGGGLFMHNGRETVYSVKASIAYSNQTINSCVEYGSEEDFEKGNYNLFVFGKSNKNSGDTYLMGRDVFRIK